MYSWGRGSHGKLGHGTTDNLTSPQLVNEFVLKRVIDVDAGYWQSVALTDEGEVYAWGSSNNGQLGLGDEQTENALVPVPVPFFVGQKITQICCADGHCAAINNKNELYTWGAHVANLETFTALPLLIEVKETMSYRVLGESLNLDSDDGTEIALTLGHFQQLLEDTLSTKHGQFRPTMLLRLCADYQNWRAASLIYRDLHDFAAEIRCISQTCIVNSAADKENTCNTLLFRHHEILKGNKLKPEDSAHVLLVLIVFWSQQNLPIERLEEHILKYIPELADGVSALMESDKYPRLPFSAKVFLSVSRHKLHQYKTNNPFSCEWTYYLDEIDL